MTRLHSHQTGIGFVLVLVALVVVGLAAIVGLKVMNHDGASLTAQTKVPAQVKNSSDLTKASSALDKTAVDTGVNTDQLDSDLNSLL